MSYLVSCEVGTRLALSSAPDGDQTSCCAQASGMSDSDWPFPCNQIIPKRSPSGTVNYFKRIVNILRVISCYFDKSNRLDILNSPVNLFVMFELTPCHQV